MKQKTKNMETATISLEKYHELLKIRDGVKRRKAIRVISYGVGYEDNYYIENDSSEEILFKKIKELQEHNDLLIKEVDALKAVVDFSTLEKKGFFKFFKR